MKKANIRRHLQTQSECTALQVAEQLAAVFPYTYRNLVESLCDPLRRSIQDLRCEVGRIDSPTSGAIRCVIEFRCSGSCGEWLGPTEIYQEETEEFTASSSSCNCDAGDAKRAPVLQSHLAAINDEFYDVVISSISLL